MRKRNGRYVYRWAESAWTGPDYRVAYALSDSPLGPFNKQGSATRASSLEG
ncbi:hypothetical protein [Paenibacillus sp. PL91]|uniref:hypothetical protein n=1 Tax=Paenibacillus sp. PL91 TaxID=2729538 RepID=UPI00145EB449|nr:hypothetical protein [Paenibacillus sp. PL91]MBC9199235.1 hypothetical protein [Paenibacillus sp. PL91]